MIDLELTRQRVRPLPIDRREVDRLGTRAHLARHEFKGHVEDHARGLAMDITAGAEGLDERRVVREVREQAQLDLRVVCCHEAPSCARNEAPANVLPELPADRDVLQVRVARREATGARDRLVERGVQSPCARIHQRRKRVEVGVLELRELAVLHEQPRQGVPLVGEFLQHARVGARTRGGLLLDRQPELLEEDRPQLLIGRDVELLARLAMDLALELAARGLESRLERMEPMDVDRHAGPLHLGEHVHKRKLHLAEQRAHFMVDQPRLEERTQAQRDVAVGAGVVAPSDDRHLVVWDPLLALAAQFVVAGHRDAEELDRERVERVRAPARVEHVAREHRVEIESLQRHAGAAQHEEVILGVVRGLAHGRILEQRAQRLHRLREERREIHDRMRALGEQPRGDRTLCGRRFLGLHRSVAEGQPALRLPRHAVREREVPRLARRRADGDRHEVRAHWRDDRWGLGVEDRLGVDRDHAGRTRFGDHLRDECGGVGKAIVGGDCVGGPGHNHARLTGTHHVLVVPRAGGRTLGGALRDAHRSRLATVNLHGGRARGGIELEFDEEIAERRPVRRSRREGVGIEGDREVVLECHESLAQARGVDLLRERVARARRLDLVDMREHLLHRAPLCDQRERALVTDAAHTGHVVGGIANEREIVDDALWRDTKPLVGILAAVPLLGGAPGWAVPRIEHPDLGADELDQVLVARHDADLEPLCRALLGERRDHVVRLEAVEREGRDTIRGEQLPHAFKTGVEVLLFLGRQRDAIRLVRRE